MEPSEPAAPNASAQSPAPSDSAAPAEPIAPAAQPEAPATPAQEAPRTIAVVGEIPFAGAAVAKELYNAGFSVRVLCPDERAEQAALAARSSGTAANTLEAIRGCIDSEVALSKALEGATGAVFISPVSHEGRLYRSSSHLADCRRVIAAAEGGAVRKLVYHSALGAHPKATSRTMREAAEAEALFQNSRCEDYCIRTAPLMGRGDRLMAHCMEKARRASPFMLVEGYGSTMLQPLYVGDLAACLLRIFRDQPGELAPGTYQLAGPEAVSLMELYDRALARAGRFKFKFHFPLFAMRLAAMVRPGSAFEERLNLLYDMYFTEHNDVARLTEPGFKARTIQQVQDEALSAA